MSVSSESLIQPAPAQTVLESQNSIVCRSPVPTQSIIDPSQLNSDDKVKNLSRTLRVINNICGPVCEYANFQRNLLPDVRIITDINQWMMAMYAIKGLLKGFIDDQYMNIQDPSQSLKQSMERAYNNIDLVSDSFAGSMKEVLTLVQSRLSQEQVTKQSSKLEHGILSTMIASTESRLPQ